MQKLLFLITQIETMGNEGVQDLVPVLRSVVSADDTELSPMEQNSVTKLVDISADDPSQLLHVIPHLQALLQHDDAAIREHAAHTARNIARAHPEDAQHLHEELCHCLSDDAVNVRKHTIQALEYLSRDYPHKSWEAVADIIPLCADENQMVRQGTDWVFDNILDDQPDDMQDIVHSLRPLLAKNDVEIKQRTTYVVAKLSVEHPDTVRSILPALRSVLSDSDTKVRQHSIQAINNIAAEHPESLKSIATDLRPRLADHDETVAELTTQILTSISVEYPLLEHDATQTLEKAEKAQSHNAYATAAKHYSAAIETLKQASAAAEPFDNSDHQELQSKLAAAEDQLERTENARAQRAAIRETLQTAERNFQEAIVRFAADSHTVSKTRFRQARDGFDDAHELLTESDEPMLASSIDISVEQRVEFPSLELEDYHSLGASAIDGLSSANISQVSDLEPDKQKIMPAVVATLRDTDTISKQETILLTLLSWWGGDSAHAFGSETAISRRYKQADFGFAQSK